MHLALKVFSAAADVVERVLYSSGGIRFLLHYLDDFLFIGSPGTNGVAVTQENALAMFNELGVPVATHRTEGLATRMTFLGIVIDTQEQTVQTHISSGYLRKTLSRSKSL